MLSEDYQYELLDEIKSHFGIPKLFSYDFEQIFGGADTVSYRVKLRSNREINLFLRIYRKGSENSAPREFETMAGLYEQGIAIPRPYFYRNSPSLGRSYMIMEFIEGMLVADLLGREDDQAQEILFQLMELLVKFHSVEPKLIRKGVPLQEEKMEKQLAWFRKRDEQYDIGAIRELVSWLGENKPRFNDPVIIHGDYHPLNVIRGKNGLVAIDLANITTGDFREDLAFFITSMGDEGESLADPITEIYEKLSGKKVENLEYFVVLSGIFNLLRGYSVLTNPEITGETAGDAMISEHGKYIKYLYHKIKKITSVEIPEFENLSIES